LPTLKEFEELGRMELVEESQTETESESVAENPPVDNA
jgi:hypothetical protein